MEDSICKDCGKKLETKENLETKEHEIVGGKLLKYKISEDEFAWCYKCDECFAKDTSLKNFRKCEVYSRVVGYIRPVQQWHRGKQQEFSERKDFTLPDENKIDRSHLDQDKSLQ